MTYSPLQKTTLAIGLLYIVIAVAASTIFRDDWCLPLVLCNKPGLMIATATLGGILTVASFIPPVSQRALQLGSLLLLGSAIIGYLPATNHLFITIFGLAPTTPLNFINLVAGTSGAIVGFTLWAKETTD